MGHCYLIGAPRSGTTWLQRLLAAHPAIVSSQETDLWDGYLAPWFRKWREDLPADPDQWARQRHKGLPAVLTEPEFHALVGQVVSAVFAKTLAAKPGAIVVLDKTPATIKHVADVAAADPDARFLHIVRDGRDVAVSLLNAGRGWGRSWAPTTVADAASFWAAHVDRAPESAHEIRYEALLRHDAGALRDCFAFLDITITEQDAAALFAGQNLDAAKQGTVDDPLIWSGEVAARLGGAPSEPAGFYGEGQVGRWRSWSRRDRIAFETVAGHSLRRFGYEPDDKWVAAGPLSRTVYGVSSPLRAKGRTARQAARMLIRGT